MNLEQCDEMIRTAKETGRKLKVFENFRFYEPYQVAKKLLHDGAIGEPQGIRMKMNNANLGSRAIPPPDGSRAPRAPAAPGGRSV